MPSPEQSTVVASLVNGVPEDSISVLDRGLHYADGVFETIPVANGRAQLWEQHMQRLRLGCERLGIPCPSVEAMAMEVAGLCANRDRAVLKLIITRGVAGRGYQPPSEARPNRIALLYSWPEHPREHWDQGIRLGLCSTRLSPQPALAGVKHLARLEHVLGAAECARQRVPEGVMLNLEGFVVEGTMSNIFLVTEGRLRTPDLTTCGLAGIMRKYIIERASALGRDVEICELNVDALRAGDELFVCNSVIGVWPVRAFQSTDFGEPGPTTRRLLEVIRTELAL